MQYSNLKERELYFTDYYGTSSYLKSPGNITGDKSRRGTGLETFFVDFGTSITKAGNLNHDRQPILVCPTETLRTKRNNQEIAISGNNVLTDFSKASAKRIFDDFNQVDYKLFEDFCDYTFTELQVQANDRLFFTEPLGLISKFRENCFELFFECYEFAEIMPVVDSVAASYEIWKQHNTANSMVISIGATKTTILPFVNSNLDVKSVKRLNVGVESMKTYFTKLFNLKYVGLSPHLNAKMLSLLFEREAFCSIDYKTQLRFYRQAEYEINKDFRFMNNLDEDFIQSLNSPVILTYFQTQEEKARIEEQKRLQALKRQENSKKMAALAKDKREEKLRQMEDELIKLEDFVEQNNKITIKNNLQLLGYNSEEELQSRIKVLRKKLNKEPIVEPTEKFRLLSIPDEELSPRSIKVKKFQFIQKMNLEKRIEKRAAKEQKQQEIERMKTKNPELYVQNLKEKRKQLNEMIKRIKVFHEDTRLKKQKDNQLIQNLDNYLEGKKEKHNTELDNAIRDLIDISSDYEKYEQELDAVNQQIKEVEPTFDEDFDNEDILLQNKFGSDVKVYFGTDLTRSVEMLFRPHLIGSVQKGLFESVRDIIETYDQTTKEKVLGNIFVVGGGANIKGIDQRLERDLFLHFTKNNIGKIRVQKTDNPMFTAYEGVRDFYTDFKDNGIEEWIYTRKEYQEYGVSLFKGCPIGNL